MRIQGESRNQWMITVLLSPLSSFYSISLTHQKTFDPLFQHSLRPSNPLSYILWSSKKLIEKTISFKIATDKAAFALLSIDINFFTSASFLFQFRTGTSYHIIKISVMIFLYRFSTRFSTDWKF